MDRCSSEYDMSDMRGIESSTKETNPATHVHVDTIGRAEQRMAHQSK